MQMDHNKQTQQPDFDELNDRVIENGPSGPQIGARTNLDKENPQKYDPYTKENHSFFERP